MKVKLSILAIHFMNIKYRISSNKRPWGLFNFEASDLALIGGRHLFYFDV